MIDEKLLQARKVLIDCLEYGKENAIPCEKLAFMIGLTERKVQRLVHDVRRNFDDVVLSEPGKGYWLSNDREEIREFIEKRDIETKGRFLTVKNIRKELRKYDMQMSMDDFDPLDGNNLKGSEVDGNRYNQTEAN